MRQPPATVYFFFNAAPRIRGNIEVHPRDLNNNMAVFSEDLSSRVRQRHHAERERWNRQRAGLEFIRGPAAMTSGRCSIEKGGTVTFVPRCKR